MFYATAQVDILHETSEVLEASYERMFVWVQQQCRRDTAVAKGTSGAEQAQMFHRFTFIK